MPYHVPVYDERGEPYAASVRDAAIAVGCAWRILYGYLEPYRDGWRLTGRPLPENCGRRGGRKVKREEAPDATP